MLVAPAGERFALELPSIVHIQGLRLATHRPGRVDSEPLQPGPLVTGRMGQAQPHRHRRGRLQGHHHSNQTPTAHVDGHRQIRPSDRLTVTVIDHDQIHDRVIDLHLVQDRLDYRNLVPGRLQRPDALGPLAPPAHLDRIHPSDPRGHRVPCRSRQPLHGAGPRDLPMQGGNAALLPGQVPLAHQLTDDLLHWLRQPAPTLATIRSPGDKISDQARAPPVPLQQHVHPAPGDPQLHRGFVDGSQSHWIVLGQATDHPGPQPGLLPLTLGHRKHARSSHLILVAVHARLLIENRTTEQMRR